MKYLLVICLIFFSIGCSMDISEKESIELVEQARKIIHYWGIFFVCSACILSILSIYLILDSLIKNRFGPVKVFISYFHKNAQVAERIANQLASSKIDVDLIPFKTGDYDEIITDVRDGIANSSLLVVIPGDDRSFVDAEVLAASTLRKPIVFIKTKASTLPDTAYTGYPSLDWERLNKVDTQALSNFIVFICRHWSVTLQEMIKISKLFIFSLLGLTAAAFPFIFVLDLVASVITYVNPSSGVWFKSLIPFGLLFITVVLTAGITLIFVYVRISTLAVCRQTVLTRKATYSRLRKILTGSDQEIILDCLDDVPMQRRNAK
jgi:hypothetical protein